MLPPPGFSAIISGLIYGFRVTTGQITAGDANAYPQDAPAVWDALWASWLISLIIGIPMLTYGEAWSICCHSW